jgi:hypothetical protein
MADETELPVAGRYRLIELLGQVGLARVWRNAANLVMVGL